MNINTLLHVTERPEIVIEKGKGMYLWDTEGKKYLDFIGGWAVCSLGHSPRVISKAIKKQSRKVINSSPSFYNKPMLEYANKLVNNSVFDRVWFGNSGAEVNEAAIKLARKYGKKFKDGAYKIVTTANSFHGRTLALMRATGKDHWKDIFSPMPEGFIHVPFNDIEGIKKSIDKDTVAIMIEPVQGEGGVYPADKDYIVKLREVCNKENILLIFDEVQTGFGRTGNLFAYQHYNIEPDIITLAKGIGGGFPLSAIMAKEKLNIFDCGDQGGTFGGQQLAMSVGEAVLDELLTNDIINNVKESGNYLINCLNKITQKYSFKNIRGLGLLIGLDLPDNRGGEIVKLALEQGLIINSPKPNMLRFIPPLITSKKDIDIMMGLLEKTLDKVYCYET